MIDLFHFIESLYYFMYITFYIHFTYIILSTYMENMDNCNGNYNYIGTFYSLISANKDQITSRLMELDLSSVIIYNNHEHHTFFSLTTHL